MRPLLDFMKSVVRENGGDVELDENSGGLEVLVPRELGTLLDLPDAVVTLVDKTNGDDEKTIKVGYGTELLERAIALALAKGRTAAVRMNAPVSRKPAGPAVDRHLVFPNTSYKHLAEQKSWCDYWVWTYHIAAEADERYENVCHVCISQNGVQCNELIEQLHLRIADLDELRISSTEQIAQSIEQLEPVAVDRLLGILHSEIEGFTQTVERHYARDANRIHAYFEDLRRETAEEIERRNLKGEALAIRQQKQIQFSAEESAKLASLKDKYRIRITVEPRALLLARLPVTRCDLLIKRRKIERRLSVIYNLLSKRVDPLACEACGAHTLRPSFCDSACHLLCEDCLLKSGGRGMRTCPRCRSTGRPLTLAAVFKRKKVRSIKNESP